MELGVCYYPEQWPTAWWADDARRMRDMGIRWVRIAEFAWSQIEPEPGVLDWAWLDQAVNTLHEHGLRVVMCTPTATPPKWLIDRMPDMVARDLNGQPRKFGSRRHYCFSHAGYRSESRRITRLVAERYGKHPGVGAWQTDNEYGCHDTVLSTSDAALQGFRHWLVQRYGSTEALNQAWGTVFWSQTYRSFDEVDLPAQTVTEANPTHRLDWRRFASSEVRAFNREQTLIIRELSPGRPVTHNFMGFFTEFNHHEVAQDLDIATWDSYPLGFTQNFFLNSAEKVRYARTGHPDIPAFHHDLYRGMCQGRWWVMEQQPGPVNWASWNPAPHDGMVRLWTWQAFAHGAEVVSYFRWRQAPFAQEQMHTGLHRPDRTLDQGGLEASQVGAELAQLAAQGWDLTPAAVAHRVALVFDYESLWMAQIQPQGADFNPLELHFRVYSALRQLGLDVDLVAPNQTLQNHTMVVLPAQLHVSDPLAAELRAAAQSGTHLVLGPRFGSKSAHLSFPEDPEGGALVPPGTLVDLTGYRVERVASMPPGMTRTLTLPGGQPAQAQRWCEDAALAGAKVVATFDDDGRPALTRHGTVHGTLGWLSDNDWVTWLGLCARAAGLPAQELPQDVRVSQWGNWLIACNFSDRTHTWQPGTGHAPGFQNVMGSTELPPHGISLWHRPL